MGATTQEFEIFEQQFIELIGEYQTISGSEKQLRAELRKEATRAEGAEAARDAAERAAAETRASATAATAGAAQAAKALASAQEELVTVKMQLDLSENQRRLFEDKCTEMSDKINCLQKELQQLQPLQSAHGTIQRQYIELQGRIQNVTEEARSEVSKLEVELQRVERCAGAGAELRERARLAAAAHARERTLAANELAHTTRELHAANAEIARLKIKVTELQYQLSNRESLNEKHDPESQALAEVRAALEAERSGTAKLERALAAALADNATLASELHIKDNDSSVEKTSIPENPSSNICPIDSFLAD
ncbi:rootletin-like [Vanessa atalanta]|uniref:rootletin-like n=1 Tax=Vanessa atalanta TaxID=42275 RepID=UPI001FCE22C3|nr:rootletin-like [Vanessa atalanta]